MVRNCAGLERGWRWGTYEGDASGEPHEPETGNETGRTEITAFENKGDPEKSRPSFFQNRSFTPVAKVGLIKESHG